MVSRNRKPRDDITALVIDFLPPDSPPDARLPPLLASSGRGGARGSSNGSTGEDVEPVDIFWPLTGEGSGHWRRDAW